MPNLSRYPTPIQEYFVRPHVKTGDYYLFMNPHSGRREWVYPRKMGEDRYAVVSSLGTDSVTAAPAGTPDIQGWLNSLMTTSPTALTAELASARADLSQSLTLTKVAIGVSIIASLLTIWMFFKVRPS